MEIRASEVARTDSTHRNSNDSSNQVHYKHIGVLCVCVSFTEIRSALKRRLD